MTVLMTVHPSHEASLMRGVGLRVQAEFLYVPQFREQDEPWLLAPEEPLGPAVQRALVYQAQQEVKALAFTHGVCLRRSYTDAPLCSQHRKQQIAATIHGEGEFSAEPTLPDTEHIWNTQGMDFHMVDRSDEVPTLPNSRDLSHPGVWTALLSF